MQPAPMKLARIYCGVCVDGTAVMANAMIPADHEVCNKCLGSGRNSYDDDCQACEGLGTVPQIEGDRE